MRYPFDDREHNPIHDKPKHFSVEPQDKTLGDEDAGHH
jgi:hypothetical protein